MAIRETAPPDLVVGSPSHLFIFYTFAKVPAGIDDRLHERAPKLRRRSRLRGSSRLPSVAEILPMVLLYAGSDCSHLNYGAAA